MAGKTKFRNQIMVLINTIIHSLTPKIPKKYSATLPLTAKSKNWNVGNEEAKK